MPDGLTGGALRVKDAGLPQAGMPTPFARRASSPATNGCTETEAIEQRDQEVAATARLIMRAIVPTALP
jgi:hypothetical protein